MSAHQLLRLAGRAPRRFGTIVLCDYVDYQRLNPVGAVIVCQNEAYAVATAARVRRWLRNVADDDLYNMHVNYWLKTYGEGD